ncbi:hypothetical protein KP509_22G071000 [Ceratopteris richardii]|uniref:Uncharacterized protein n=1 Tax=Ceratopteris richardii TaxID=49495 RepID=A0A8T2S9K4_CERRI|nr:hypothetical protein KP509_22G071000 [Ceratopteris richardii]
MGSLKRKNASIGASTGSNKRHSREDASAGSVAANGCTEKRSAEAQTYRPPSSSSSEAADGDAVELVIPTTEALCNGVSPAANTINASLSLTKSDSRKNHTISSNEPACPADSEEQEADIAIVFPESPYSKNLGSLTPNHAGWFSWTSIHAMEQRELPDFFNSKSKLKTPSLYLEYRNLFLRKYLENPDKVFTFAEVSQIIEQKDGHLEAAKRIFGFLNHWGLLNSRAMQHAEVERPTRSKVCITERSSEQPEMSLFSSLYHFNNLAANNSLRSSFAYEMVMPKIVMKESAASDIHGGTQETSIEYHCNSCSADCSKKRFHCQKKADFDLCQDCYNEEKFASGVTSTDFILMDAATDASCGDGWSEQETLLLLEALEMFGDNFSEIAEHVASKTKAQCILHFIRLPIEDQFLDDSGPIAPPVVDPTENANNAELASQMNGQEDFLGSSNGELDQEDEMLDSENSHQVHLLGDEEKSSSTMHAIKAAAEAAGLCSSGKYLALSECSNPVMTLVSFLAALVAPDAVAMSAQTALKLLADHASALQLADKNSFHLELEASPTDGISCIVGEQEEVEMSEAASDVKEITDVGGDTSKPDKVSQESIIMRRQTSQQNVHLL